MAWPQGPSAFDDDDDDDGSGQLPDEAHDTSYLGTSGALIPDREWLREYGFSSAPGTPEPDPEPAAPKAPPAAPSSHRLQPLAAGYHDAYDAQDAPGMNSPQRQLNVGPQAHNQGYNQGYNQSYGPGHGPGNPRRMPTGGPDGYYERMREAEERQMAAFNPIQSLPGVFPPNVTELALLSPARTGGPASVRIARGGLGIEVYDNLPPMTLAMLFTQSRRVMFNDRLFAEVTPQALEHARLLPSSQQGGWPALLEPVPLRRVIVALAWIRWYLWPEIVADTLRIHADELLVRLQRPQGPFGLPKEWSPQMAGVLAFAPHNAVRWSDQQSRYYTRLWRNLSQLLLNHEQITAQTAYYVRHYLQGRRLPSDLAVRRQFIEEAGIASGLSRDVVWRDYMGFLTASNRVPQTIVKSRLRGDMPIESARDLCGVTDHLCSDFHDLVPWRREASLYFGVPANQIALWLLEPASTLQTTR